MNTPSIERNAEPPRPARMKTGHTELLRQLLPGDAVTLPDTQQPNVAGLLTGIRRHTGLRYTTRKVAGGVRVWCLGAQVRL